MSVTVVISIEPRHLSDDALAWARSVQADVSDLVRAELERQHAPRERILVGARALPEASREECPSIDVRLPHRPEWSGVDTSALVSVVRGYISSLPGWHPYAGSEIQGSNGA